MAPDARFPWENRTSPQGPERGLGLGPAGATVSGVESTQPSASAAQASRAEARARAQRIIEQLRRESPAFHGGDQEPSRNLRIRPDALEWIAQNVTPGMTTLETGCGYSSVLFAACGARHTSVSPAALEHARVRAWCEQNGVPVELLSFEDGPSERVLPTLGEGPIDLMLIDGMHAFPWPFVDFFFTADRLSVGGFLLIDDVSLRSGEALREFLIAERGRWELVTDLKATSIFRKTSAPSLAGLNWHQQPWGARPVTRWKRRIRQFRQRFQG